eukprot:5714601-Pyramimonas_sp.AAC.1
MDDNKKHTLPQYLHSKHITDRRAVRRPDIVLIFRVRGDRRLPEAYVPLGKGDDKRISPVLSPAIILDVCGQGP